MFGLMYLGVFILRISIPCHGRFAPQSAPGGWNCGFVGLNDCKGAIEK